MKLFSRLKVKWAAERTSGFPFYILPFYEIFETMALEVDGKQNFHSVIFNIYFLYFLIGVEISVVPRDPEQFRFRLQRMLNALFCDAVRKRRAAFERRFSRRFESRGGWVFFLFGALDNRFSDVENVALYLPFYPIPQLYASVCIPHSSDETFTFHLGFAWLHHETCMWGHKDNRTRSIVADKS